MCQAPVSENVEPQPNEWKSDGGNLMINGQVFNVKGG